MTRFLQIFGVALISATLSAEPNGVAKHQPERQPGTLRIFGLQERDRVMVDGEFLGDGKRLMQFGSKLLINPGKYRVTVLSAETMNACESLVVVRENQTAIARCAPDTVPQEQLVD